jgi:hypothetical protein
MGAGRWGQVFDVDISINELYTSLFQDHYAYNSQAHIIMLRAEAMIDHRSSADSGPVQEKIERTDLSGCDIKEKIQKDRRTDRRKVKIKDLIII